METHRAQLLGPAAAAVDALVALAARVAPIRAE